MQADDGDREDDAEFEGEDGDDTGLEGEDRDDEFLERFVRITTDRSSDFEGKLRRLLDLGRDRLDLSIGFASRIRDQKFSLLEQQGADDLIHSLVESGRLATDVTIPLETTYCRRTVEDGGVLAFTHGSEEGWDGDPAHEQFGLETYIGGRVIAGDDVVGTLCFADERKRSTEFSDDERLFVELLADWLGNELDRRRARTERAETTERLENTLERIDDGFFALDDEWRFTYVNETAATLLDRDPDGLVGENVWTEFPEALGELYERKYREAMDEQRAVSFEEYYEPLDLWTEVTAYPSAEGLSVFFQDVSERKQRERTLRELLTTSERFHLADDTGAIADRLVEAAADVLGYEISGVRLYDPDEDALELVAMSDGLRERFGSRSPRDPGDGVVGSAFASGTYEVCSDLETLEDGRDYRGVRSVIAVPLGTHGVLTVGSTEPDAFEESDVSIVQLLATNATAAMERVDRQKRLRTYERALENVDDMVCVLDDDGHVTYVTRPLAAWLDAERVDLLDEHISTVIPGHGDVVTDALAALDMHESDGPGEPVRDADVRIDDGTATLPLSIPRGDGSVRRGELRLSALGGREDGAVGSVTDTTELNRARSERDRERDRFMRLFERLPDPVVEVALEDDETVVRQVNDAFVDLFGYDPETIRGRRMGDLGLSYDRHVGDVTERSLDERVREEGFVTAEVRRRTVDGPREFLFRGFSYGTPDGPHAFGIYTDITERKHRERYLQVANRILRHNLRNEVNVVFGFASEIARLSDDDRVVDYATRIETTGQRLADLGDGAAEIKRVVEDGLRSELEPVSVRPVARDVVGRYAGEHPNASLAVSVPASATVHADERLEDVLDNLVENALVHADGSSPRVEIGTEPDPDPGVVAVTVADDGTGISEDIRAVVAGEAEITQLRHNSGIGLWIVAWVVESYGGDIEFGPGLGPDGGGTTVRLRLPRREPSPGP